VSKGFWLHAPTGPHASAEPVAARALWRLIPMPYSASEVLEALRERCQGRGVQLVEVGGGWQFRTAYGFSDGLVAPGAMLNP
jgi:segregation and condensation protein B